MKLAATPRLETRIGGKNSRRHRYAAESCDTCPVGRFSGAPGAELCDLCPAGAAAELPGSASCAACAAGTYATAAGLAPGIGLTSGATNCSKCPAGTRSANESSFCDLCDFALGFTSAEGSAACDRCNPAFYWNGDGCEPCPGRASCPAGATTSSLQVHKDYWRADAESVDIIECVPGVCSRAGTNQPLRQNLPAQPRRRRLVTRAGL